MAFDIEMIKMYSAMPSKVNAAKQALGRPLTLAEKILFSHLHDDQPCKTLSAQNICKFCARPRRHAGCYSPNGFVAVHAGRQAKSGSALYSALRSPDHRKTEAKQDLQKAVTESKEVYDFLASVSNKYGIGFWKPGAGIIHQVVLENYAFPGGMMIGTDSHTVNAGGLGMIAIGVGGADACDVMAGLPWELKWPKLIGVKLTGKLSGWTAPKDVILKVAGILTVKGGTGAIVEYFGEGATSMSCTGKGTICNMGAEIGATTSTFGYDDSMSRYRHQQAAKKLLQPQTQ